MQNSGAATAVIREVILVNQGVPMAKIKDFALAFTKNRKGGRAPHALKSHAHDCTVTYSVTVFKNIP